jgi:hypothetical protein
MGPAFEVYPYSIEKLAELLSARSLAPPRVVADKLHRTYFEGYFGDLKALTILVENHYIDRDFLEDYAAYYVRCFRRYKRFCSRLHFFWNEFEGADIEALLEGNPKGRLTQEILQEHYLGFVVVKPLPQTIIGRTCLKTYPEDHGRRSYPIVRVYEAHPFGIRLGVNSLAFQEQDQVAAACATSALWSVFQGTGKLFQHPIPSPVEITRAATEDFPLETRSLPNHGLTLPQIAHAIQSVGLEPLLVRASNEYILNSTAYAYVRGGIPLVLGVDLANIDEHSDHSLHGKVFGQHALAITGYSLGRSAPEPEPKSGFLLRACRMDKLYAHDDQVGPFARLVWDGRPVWSASATASESSNGKEEEFPSLTTSWRRTDAIPGEVRALPFALITPLYHKIRIPFQQVHDLTLTLDVLLWRYRATWPFTGRLEWDIFLTTVSDLKASLRSNGVLTGPRLRESLVDEMPRFLWRAIANSESRPVVELLFDATDIEQGCIFFKAIEYDLAFSLYLRGVLGAPILENTYGGRPVWQIIKWFLTMPAPVA